MGAISITFITIGITGLIGEEEVERKGGKMKTLFAKILGKMHPDIRDSGAHETGR